MAAPSFSFTAARYPKYSHWKASFASRAGRETSKPCAAAIAFKALSAAICNESSSANRNVASWESSFVLGRSSCFGSERERRRTATRSFFFSSTSASTPRSATLR